MRFYSPKSASQSTADFAIMQQVTLQREVNISGNVAEYAGGGGILLSRTDLVAFDAVEVRETSLLTTYWSESTISS